MKSIEKPGCVGAVLVHPLLFVLAFLKGAIFGHAQPIVMGAASGHGDVKTGAAGGMNAVEEVFIGYVMTLGIAPIIVSVIGVGLGYLVLALFSDRK